MIVVVWGVSGCGKSTVGKLLADQLGWAFHDADDFHPASNINKMRRGISLDDEDRHPWLARLAELLRDINDDGRSAVLACSALKQKYRFQLGINQDDIKGVHLSGAEEVIAARLTNRSHDFMSNDLLDSQFAALETCNESLSLDITLSPEALCEIIVTRFELN
jgi:gluconokinase